MSDPSAGMMEQTLYRARPAWRHYSLFYVLGFVAITMLPSDVRGPQLFLPVGVAFVAAALLRWRKLFIVTDQRVVSRTGLIARHVSETPLRDVIGIKVDQGVFDRLLNIGRITMGSAVESDGQVVFQGISRPEAVRSLIWNLLARGSSDSSG